MLDSIRDAVKVLVADGISDHIDVYPVKQDNLNQFAWGPFFVEML